MHVDLWSKSSPAGTRQERGTTLEKALGRGQDDGAPRNPRSDILENALGVAYAVRFIVPIRMVIGLSVGRAGAGEERRFDQNN